jgi:two-component system, NarL family, invasion response regulator UvrY
MEGRTIRVVTVDDQAPFREAARVLVDGTPGFELVGESSGGEAALDLVRDCDPDMVVIDVRMPGIDGIEVAHRLSAEDSTRVLVLATSADLHEFSPLAHSCGAAALVQKRWLTPRLLRGLWIAHRRR